MDQIQVGIKNLKTSANNLATIYVEIFVLDGKIRDSEASHNSTFKNCWPAAVGTALVILAFLGIGHLTMWITLKRCFKKK